MGLEKGHLVKWSLPLVHIPAQVFFLSECCFLLCKLGVEILEPFWGLGEGVSVITLCRLSSVRCLVSKVLCTYQL